MSASYERGCLEFLQARQILTDDIELNVYLSPDLDFLEIGMLERVGNDGHPE